MDVRAIRTASLGDTSYLVTHGSSGLIVDPQRDLSRFVDAVEEAQSSITHVLDTHVHNDYLSGTPSLAKALGADPVLPAGSGAAFSFRPSFHMEDIEAEELTIQPIHTPGHTPDHMSYLIASSEHRDDDALALFSGGSLLVGSAGRTDLLGLHLARQLARLQHGSVTRLAALPEKTSLYPTHGAGSFCTSTRAGHSSSTIRDELAANPALSYASAESFADGQLSGLLPYPAYYREMAPLNLLGPAPADETGPADMTASDFADLIDHGASCVDARPRAEFLDEHIPGSLGIGAGSSMAAWVGWLVSFGTPIALVVNDSQEASSISTDLTRIGYETTGVLRTLGAWKAEERPISSIPHVPAKELPEGETVVDVRDPAEWESGHVRGSVHCYVPDLVNGPPVDVADPWLICGSGYRASIASGILEGQGLSPRVVSRGGVTDVLAGSG